MHKIKPLLVLPALFLLRFYFVEIGFVKVDGGNLMGFFAAQNGITYRTTQDEMESFMRLWIIPF